MTLNPKPMRSSFPSGRPWLVSDLEELNLLPILGVSVEDLSLPLGHGTFQLLRLPFSSLLSMADSCTWTLSRQQTEAWSGPPDTALFPEPHKTTLSSSSSEIDFWPLKPRDKVTKQWFPGSSCGNTSLWVNGSHASADNTALILSSSSQRNMECSSDFSLVFIISSPGTPTHLVSCQEWNQDAVLSESYAER